MRQRGCWATKEARTLAWSGGALMDQTLARICRALLTTPNELLGFSAEDSGQANEASLLLDRAMAALGAMDLRSLRLAADVLDVIARGSDDRSET